MSLTYEEKIAVAREIQAGWNEKTIQEGLYIAGRVFPGISEGSIEAAVFAGLINHSLTIGYAIGKGFPASDLLLSKEEQEVERVRMSEHWLFMKGGAS